MNELLKVLRTFYKYVSIRRGLFVVFILILIVSGVVSSIFPYFYKLLVDALPSLNFDTLLGILILFVGVRVLSLLLRAISYLVGDIITFPAGIQIRLDVFRRIQDLDFAFHANKSTGSLISRMKRGDGAFWSLHHAIHYRILDVFIEFMVMMYFFSSIDPKIVLLVSISFLLSLAVTRYIVDYNVSTRVLFNKEEDNISGIIVDNIINYETVKLFAKEDWEYDKLKKSFIPWKERLWQHAMSFRLFDISIGSIVNISIFLVLLYSIRLAVDTRLSVGDLVLVLGFVNSFFPRLFDLVFGFRDIAKNYADIQKYFGILDYKVLIKDPSKPKTLNEPKGEIVFKDVWFSYKEGKKNAIKKFNLRIRQGQSVALIGRSGSGKTTITKLILRFFDVNDGSVSIDGVDVRDMTKSHVRSFIGVVPQEPIMFNNTIGYNVGYGNDKCTKKEIVAAAKLANLHDFIETLPLKYSTNVGERGIKLSGGQKQRLAIARMILSNPEIIIFDEATSHLDSENEKLIQEAFWKATKDKTTIIIAHRLSTAMRADKIIVMDEGEIVEVGSHKELLNKDSLYKYFWELQVSGV